MAQFLVLIILYNINLGSTTTGSFFLVLFIHGMSIWHLLFLFLLSFLISYLSGKLAHFFLFQPFRNTCYVTKFVFHSFKQNSLNAVFHHVRFWMVHFHWIRPRFFLVLSQFLQQILHRLCLSLHSIAEILQYIYSFWSSLYQIMCCFA